METPVRNTSADATGVSRSGRVRKRSSKLADFESPDEIDIRFKRKTDRPQKSPKIMKVGLSMGADIYDDSLMTSYIDDDLIEVKDEPLELDDWVDNDARDDDMCDDGDDRDDTSDALHVEEDSTDIPSETSNYSFDQSLYFSEKQDKKNIMLKDGQVVRRKKAQRKDKGKSRFTAYMLWAREIRPGIIQANPNMDFSAVNKRLGELWALVPTIQKYNWKRKAKCLAVRADQKVSMISTGKAAKQSQNAARSNLINKGGVKPQQVILTPSKQSEVGQSAPATTHKAHTTTPNTSSVCSTKENLLLGVSMASAKGRTGNLSEAAHCGDDTEGATVSITNPSTTVVVKPEISSINLPGRSTPDNTSTDSFLAPYNFVYLPEVPEITPINNDGLQSQAILARENLDREYSKAKAILQKRCAYLNRSLKLEDLNALKPANRKGKGRNYCRIIEIDQRQPACPSEDVVPASPSPPHIQSCNFSASRSTSTQTYLPVADQTPKSFDSALAAELEEINDSQSSVSERQKIKNSEVDWGESRSVVFGWTLSKLGVPEKGKHCVQCRSCEASTKCEDCFQFLCHTCDQQQHFLRPFHQRFCWKNGFLEPLDPTQTVCSDGLVINWKPVVPAHPPNSCPNCNECKFTTLSSNNLCIFITLNGRYDLYTPIFQCKCGYVHEELGKTMHQSGFYSPIGRKTNTFYSTDLLDSWHFLKRSSPATSFRALISALELFGASRGRHGPINFETTKRVFSEWRFHQHELRRIRGEAENECPACDTTPLAVHVDGNKKLYRYSKVGRGIRNSYYSGGIFAADKEVLDHISTIHSLETRSMCGVSALKASKIKPVTFGSLDEIGISKASCRHGIILSALNMYEEELSSYAHYLQMNRFHNAAFICQDIICKYWPWALNAASREQRFSVGEAKPFLGAQHAKGHSWYCQVVYGGRWQEGSGLTSGEEAEQVFSYLSGYNSNTKNMLKAERIEELTEGAAFWNDRKANGLARALVARFQKATETAAAVSNEIDRLNVSESVIDNWRSEILTIARSLNNRSSNYNIEYAIEALGEAIRSRKKRIATYAVSSKMKAALTDENECERRTLRDLIEIYNQNHEHLSQIDVENGNLPWHNVLPQQNTNLSLAERRNVVEKFELKKRCREEHSHTIQEMIRYLQYYKKKRVKLSQHIQELRCDIFPSYLHKDPKTYTIEKTPLSEEEKRGLLALLSHGLKLCADKLTEAKHLFSSYQPDEVHEPFLELCESDDDEDVPNQLIHLQVT